jgi:guanylate kinase
MPTERLPRRGLMLVLSSPSGAGKTTISRRLLEAEPDVQMSISATTRPKRPREVDGRDYLFVSDAEFAAMVERHEFLEHASVFGHRYGSPRGPVEAAIKAGRDVLFDVDWQGTQQLAGHAPGDLVSIFILPPSAPELERRLHTRAQDSEDVVRERMAKAANEITHYREYDYILVNYDVDDSLAQVRAILTAERLKRDRQTGLGEFVRKLNAAL